MVEELVLVSHSEATFLVSIFVSVTAFKETVLLFHLLVLLKAVVLVILALRHLLFRKLAQGHELLPCIDLDEVVRLHFWVHFEKFLRQDMFTKFKFDSFILGFRFLMGVVCFAFGLVLSLLDSLSDV